MATSRPYPNAPSDGEFALSMKQSGVGDADPDAQQPSPAKSDAELDEQATQDATPSTSDAVRSKQTNVLTIAKANLLAEKPFATKLVAHDAGKSLTAGTKGTKHAIGTAKKETVSTAGSEVLATAVDNGSDKSKDPVVTAVATSATKSTEAAQHGDAATSGSAVQRVSTLAGDASANSTDHVPGLANAAAEATDTKSVDTSSATVKAVVLEAQNSVTATSDTGGSKQTVAQVFESRSTAGANFGAMSSRTLQASTPVRDGSADLALQSYEAPTPNQLEVGLAGGSFGWLKVRAELTSGGELHAYLRGGSLSAEDALRSQSPQMMSYLGAHEVRMTGVHVEAARSGSGESATGGGTTSRDQQEPQQNGSTQGKSGASRSNFDPGKHQSVLPSPMIPMMGQTLSGTGGWLSVRA